MIPVWFVRNALRDGIEQLRRAGVPDPEIDAGWLLEHVTKTPRLQLPLSNAPMTIDEDERYRKMLARRANREPLQYAIGEVEFLGATIKVDKRALIPRPETELLCEKCLQYLKELCEEEPMPHVLDLCTGSGVIAVALKRRCPQVIMFASDFSKRALALANDNRFLNKVSILFTLSNLFMKYKGHKFDVIISNPPYIPSRDIPSLQAEVRAEPISALDGGHDGLSILRRIAEGAPHHLNPSGALFLEIGIGQAESVRAMLAPRFHEVTVEPDLQGIPRFVTAIKPKDK